MTNLVLGEIYDSQGSMQEAVIERSFESRCGYSARDGLLVPDTGRRQLSLTLHLSGYTLKQRNEQYVATFRIFEFKS